MQRRSKPTPRDCICWISSAVESPLILTASTRPLRVIGFLACVKALEAKVKTLTASVKTLKTRADCLGVQGVTQYGSPAAGQGYFYTSDAGATIGLTTAFDAPVSGQAPGFWAATVNAACISGRAFKVGHAVMAHRTVALRAP